MINPNDYGAIATWPADGGTHWDGAIFPTQPQAMEFVKAVTDVVDYVDDPMPTEKSEWVVLWRE